jgi:AAA domain-containing protein
MSVTAIDAKVRSLTPASIGGLRIERVADRAPHFNMLVYGKSGTGKTYLAGSAQDVPEMRRVLYLDIEGGILTLRRAFPDVETVRITTWKEFQAVYDALRAGGHGYQTIILDSLTEIQKFNMNEIMRKLVEANEERDMDVPSLREWGKNLEQCRRFIRAFRDLPLNVIFIALEREDKDRMQRPIKLPSLSGKMAGEVAAFLDIVCYYNIKEVTENGETQQLRVLQSAATESVVAKDRSGLLPPAMVGPTMEQLYDTIVRKTGAMASARVAPKPIAVEAKEVPKADLGVTDEQIAALTKKE